MDGIKHTLSDLLKHLHLLPRRSGSAYEKFKSATLTACASLNITNPAQIAYIFATVEHETAGTFKPVREAFWLSEPALIRWLKRNAKPYHYARMWGRGHIQLTWAKNYIKVDKFFGLDGALIDNPDLMLNDYELSIATAVAGMKYGWFTGKKLDDYINDNTLDLAGARRIVNGRDKAHKIAKSGAKYLNQLHELNHYDLPDDNDGYV